MNETHRGWKAIAERLGCCILTAKRRVKKYKIPVIKFGKYAELDEGLYQDWLRRIEKEARNGREPEPMAWEKNLQKKKKVIIL